MVILKNRYNCNLLKQISLPCPTFKDYLQGLKGEKKKLLAFVIDNYEVKFIEECIEKKDMVRLKGVDYLDIERIDSLFGFRKYNITKWHSKEKQNLLRCLENTPVCYVYHIAAHLSSLESFYTLFGKSKEYDPIKKVCTDCEHFSSCKGTDEFRK